LFPSQAIEQSFHFTLHLHAHDFLIRIYHFVPNLHEQVEGDSRLLGRERHFVDFLIFTRKKLADGWNCSTRPIASESTDWKPPPELFPRLDGSRAATAAGGRIEVIGMDIYFINSMECRIISLIAVIAATLP
jgi:hypothetical protein